jgi:hypothetical protein
MTDAQSSGPGPPVPDAGGKVVAIVTVLILLTPFSALAAGVGSFIGMSVAVTVWGPETLGVGAMVGAGVGVLLVLAWAVVFVRRARACKVDSQIHAEKLTTYYRDMKSRGVEPSDGPVFRLLWMLGLQVPPPIFLGAWGSFLFPFGVFAPMVLTAGAVLWWQKPNSPPWIMWLTASIFLLVAIGLGVYNVKATRSMALRLQLPSWDSYAPETAPADTTKAGKTS